MGRSAKFAKRPNKAEKVARQINKPITSHNNKQRSLSPEIEGEQKFAIPLFNTSAKNRLSEHHTKPDPRLQPSSTTMADDDEDPEEAPELVEALDSEAGLKLPTKKSSKDKLKAANQALEKDGKRTERKLGEKYRKGGKEHILGGKDYVKMLESRPSGKFGHKKLR